MCVTGGSAQVAFCLVSTCQGQLGSACPDKQIITDRIAQKIISARKGQPSHFAYRLPSVSYYVLSRQVGPCHPGLPLCNFWSNRIYFTNLGRRKLPVTKGKSSKLSKKHGLQIYRTGTVTMRQDRTTWVVAFLSEIGPWDTLGLHHLSSNMRWFADHLSSISASATSFLQVLIC